MTAQQGLDPSKITTCMKCRKRPSRYLGKWAEEGLCRPCIESLPAETRVKILRDMHPEDRRRWDLDGLTDNTAPEPAGKQAAEPAASGKRQTTLRTTEADRDARRGRSAGDTPPAEVGPSVQRGTPPGLPERRRHERLVGSVPVSISIFGAVEGPSRFRGQVFQSVSLNISMGGVSIAARDPSLLDLPAGAQLRLKISLSPPSDILSCHGVVRATTPSAPEQGPGSLCVEFGPLSSDQLRALSRFLSALR